MLSQMFKQLFDNNPLTMLPTLALGIFISVFLFIGVRVLARRPAAFDEVASLPLDQGEVGHDHGN